MGFICLWLLLLACLFTAWLGSGKLTLSSVHPFKLFTYLFVHPFICSGCLCLRNLTLYPPVFYPFLFNLIYFGIGKKPHYFSKHLTTHLLGPWYIGELMTGVYGLVFAHGILVAGHFLPGSMTYLHGVFEVSLIAV